MKIGYHKTYNATKDKRNHKPIERPKSTLFLGDAPQIIFGAR